MSRPASVEVVGYVLMSSPTRNDGPPPSPVIVYERGVFVSADQYRSLLEALDNYREVAEDASGQWSDDYLWYKWGLDDAMRRARIAIAALKGES